MVIRQLKTRDELPALLVELGLTGTGVEVGVQEGLNAATILRNWPGTLWCVDPWRAYDADYADIANASQELHDLKYCATVRRLWEYSAVGRCHVWRMTGAEAANLFAPQNLDFVYLDARHDYASVVQDILAWAPIVKAGGIIAGHDYLDGEVCFNEVREGDTVKRIDVPVTTVFGVKRAVDEIAKFMGWDVHVTTDDQFPTWYVHTPPAG